MIATNEQISFTLIWLINNRSKNISRLIHEAIENPEKTIIICNYKLLQTLKQCIILFPCIEKFFLIRRFF